MIVNIIILIVVFDVGFVLGALWNAYVGHGKSNTRGYYEK